MTADRNVAIDASEVLANQLVTAQIDQNTGSKVSLTTDEFGKGTFSAATAGLYKVSSGINAANVVSGLITNSTSPLGNELFTVYPNPFSQELHLNTSLQIEKLELFSMDGSMVFEQQNPTSVLNLSHLSSGLYLLQIKSGNKVFRQKVVKN